MTKNKMICITQYNKCTGHYYHGEQADTMAQDLHLKTYVRQWEDHYTDAYGYYLLVKRKDFKKLKSADRAALLAASEAK